MAKISGIEAAWRRGEKQQQAAKMKSKSNDNEIMK
jgi:hypothetical protein